jgi:hypothetical protein
LLPSPPSLANSAPPSRGAGEGAERSEAGEGTLLKGIRKKAAKSATAAGKHHELVSKAIFEALLKQNNPENLEVRHNVRIQGLKTSHKIDVFWKFRMGGLDHSVIVEVKKHKGPVKKGDLLRFNDELLDIPGQPKGVFVSEHGYQKGALEVARGAGITAFEIREISREASRDPITVTNLSIIIVTQKPDKVALEYAILQPTVSNLRLSWDDLWIAEHPEALPENIGPVTTIVSGIQFLDADGNERTSMQRLVQDRIKEFREAGQTQLEAEFPDPTYISGLTLLNKDGIVPVGNLKIVRLTATLNIMKTILIRPWFRSTAATYLLRNAIESDHRYVLVAEHGSEMAAQVSVPLRPFRIG